MLLLKGWHTGGNYRLLCARSGLLTPQITEKQKLHSEARAAQLLSVRVYLPY